jgi:hypothetical protein
VGQRCEERAALFFANRWLSAIALGAGFFRL